MQLSSEELETLTHLNKPEVYCIDVTDRELRISLNSKGLIEWVPAPAWSGRHTYTITEAGKKELAKH